MLISAALWLVAVSPPSSEGRTNDGRSSPGKATNDAPLILAPAALLEWGENMEAAGQLNLAEKAYRALSGDPNLHLRSEARFRLAAILANQGHLTEAAVLLRQVLDEQPNAQRVRLELAGLQLRIGDEDAARRTLRAVSAGPLPPEIAQLVRRWSANLQSRKSTGLSLEVSLAPDSNINRATRSDTLGTVLGDFTIDPSGQARSGVGLGFKASGYRRFPVASGLKLVSRLNGSAQLYREKQYNHFEAEAVSGLELTHAGTSFALDLGAGQSWFGGRPFVRHLRATASARRPIGSRSAVALQLNGVAIDNRFNALQDGRSLGAYLSGEHALTSSTGIVVNVSGERFRARDPGHSARQWRVGATGWHELGRLTLFAGATFGRLAGDERLLLFPQARRDQLTSVHLGASFRDLTFRGLAPFARIARERNRSNLELYDFSRTRTEFGVSRAF